ncbi:MAG TPA: type 4a pilus biogenesis protein PilO [Anaerohalosphaeraceae bacterium]|nr:type 4a pilus biogenesis protein PilO [Anaerohalosphaeraceae bacterium]
MKKIVDHYPVTVLGLLLLAAVGLGAYQYYPVYQQRKAFRALLSEEESRLEEVRECSEQLPILYRQIRDLKPAAEQYRRLFPDEQGYSRLWQQMTEMLARTQLSDQSVRPGEVTCEDGLCSIPLEIRCTGSFDRIFELLRSFEQFDRLIRFEEISLRNDENVSGRLFLQAKARAFYQMTPSGKKNE